jgi:Ca2+-transporting ATPase
MVGSDAPTSLLTMPESARPSSPSSAVFTPDPPGLSHAQVEALLREHGRNELPQAMPRSVWRLALDVLQEPMFLLLLACGAVYLLLGDVHEAAILLGFVFVVMGVELVQERKTERALDALRDLASPRALVLRDGQRVRIAGRDVVPGDLMLLAEGDRVAADAELLQAANLSVDESLLTGESVPVDKAVGERVPCGGLVVRGQGLARVTATGTRTAMGRIGRALREIDPGASPLQQATRRMIRHLAIGVVLLSLVVVAVEGLGRGQWLQGLLAGISLAMALLPQEFAVVLAIFFALGAWRISQRNVLTQRTSALETLGAATVLCTDKTGTLTENRMSVARLVTPAGAELRVDGAATESMPEDFHALVEFAVLASHRDPFDPMEKAIQALAGNALAGTEHLHDDWAIEREYPLAPELLAMSQAWRALQDGQPIGEWAIAAKGSPEAIADLCHLGAAQIQVVRAQVERLAADGLRVLGVACARRTHQDDLQVADPHPSDPHLPGHQHAFDFTYLGLVALADPLRSEVPAAIAECRSAGIRVLMITGDHPATALSIARQAGLDHGAACISGPEIEALPADDGEAALRQRLRHVSVVARATPEHKLRIVRALQADGEVVAMTGDGVNDAPALRAADIGVAMGGRGTDVAREAAALVVTDDRFSSIVAAVRLGRRIFDNLKKASRYIISVHIPIAGLSLLPVLMDWPLILLPAHIAFLELMIDPACSVAFEAEPDAPDVMRRPPRPRDESLFGTRGLLRSVLQGLGVLAAVVAAFVWARELGGSHDQARTLGFITLVLGNVALIVGSRARSLRELLAGNRALWLVAGGAVLAMLLVVGVPGLRGVFRFAVPDAAACARVALLGLGMLAWVSLMQRWGRV